MVDQWIAHGAGAVWNALAGTLGLVTTILLGIGVFAGLMVWLGYRSGGYGYIPIPPPRGQGIDLSKVPAAWSSAPTPLWTAVGGSENPRPPAGGSSASPGCSPEKRRYLQCPECGNSNGEFRSGVSLCDIAQEEFSYQDRVECAACGTGSAVSQWYRANPEAVKECSGSRA